MRNHWPDMWEKGGQRFQPVPASPAPPDQRTHKPTVEIPVFIPSLSWRNPRVTAMRNHWPDMREKGGQRFQPVPASPAPPDQRTHKQLEDRLEALSSLLVVPGRLRLRTELGALLCGDA
jgi:hypothetical protein